jgi:GntR family transcriptional repressor for pyruvate dehydrogenase complex
VTEGELAAMSRPTPRISADAASDRSRADLGNGGHSRVSIEIATSDAVLRPLKTSESVARDIVHDIIEQGLTTGDSLPPEVAMLEHYGVSRESLREGLRLLEVQGLITIRRGPGGGPVVGTVDPANLGRMSTLFFYMAGATYSELFEAWVISESVLAELAARNPDAKAREAAMAPCLQHQTRAPDRLDQFLQQHTQFHGAIGSLANNRVLELSMRVYGQIVSHHVAVANDPRRLSDRIADDHVAIAEAIIAGHHKRARELMVQHIRNVEQFNREQMGEKVNDFIEWL